MVKHKLLKRRINKESKELRKFNVNELKDKINGYPNMHGRGRVTKNLQVTTQRLANLLKANPNIKFIPNENNNKHAGMWEWVGDEL